MIPVLVIGVHVLAEEEVTGEFGGRVVRGPGWKPWKKVQVKVSRPSLKRANSKVLILNVE